ncbi:MAG: IclR family transcriptional regulator [Bryobacteraceae bacterium]|nr:IclR family transcriptional regulator [Bryobacteraceae bacterium]MDW8380219.1 IclR family transcriptional regulator [Bryobacterales bacterium]
METKSTPPSRALAKGLDLLEVLRVESHPCALRDLAAAIGLGKASTLRLLKTLIAAGFVASDGQGRYALNGRWVSGASQVWIRRLSEAALPEMRRLNEDLAETVSLAALYGDHIRVVETLESPRHIRMSNYRDRILPPNASSLGKAITAFQEPEVQARLLSVYGIYRQTKRTITDPVEIRQHLARIRDRGWAYEMEETVPGGCCFASPIVLPSEPVRSAISVSLPVDRLTTALRKRLPAMLTNAAENISKALRR